MKRRRSAVSQGDPLFSAGSGTQVKIVNIKTDKNRQERLRNKNIQSRKSAFEASSFGYYYWRFSFSY